MKCWACDGLKSICRSATVGFVGNRREIFCMKNALPITPSSQHSPRCVYAVASDPGYGSRNENSNGEPSMRLAFLISLVLVGLGGCIHAETTPSPPPTSTTVVTPAPANSSTALNRQP